MTRILLVLLLAMPVGCCSLDDRINAGMAFGTVMWEATSNCLSLGISLLGDLRWIGGTPDLLQENGPSMEPTQSEAKVRETCDNRLP